MDDSVLVLVRVEQRHINEGKAKSCGSCPLARAINDALGRDIAPLGVGVNNTSWWGNPFGDIGGTLPFDASAFVVNYDAGLPVEPFEFEIRIPDRFRESLHLNEADAAHIAAKLKEIRDGGYPG